MSDEQKTLFDDENSWKKEWVDMPEYVQDKTEYHCIKVSFVTKADMIKFSRLIGQGVSIDTKIIYYPVKMVETSSGKVYKDEP